MARDRRGACPPRDVESPRPRETGVMEEGFATRRHLPHFEKPGKTYFITFATLRRLELPPSSRDIVLDTIVHDHRIAYWLHCAVVMPDHAHLVATPYENSALSAFMQRIKSISSHRTNRALGRRGTLWVDESFDRVIRADENIRRTCEYVVANPVRAGLVESVDDYPWIWRQWIEGARTGEGACPPLDDIIARG